MLLFHKEHAVELLLKLQNWGKDVAAGAAGCVVGHDQPADAAAHCGGRLCISKGQLAAACQLELTQQSNAAFALCAHAAMPGPNKKQINRR